MAVTEADAGASATDAPVVDDLAPTSLPALLLRRAAEMPDRVAIRKQHLGVWKQYTWADYAERATAAGMGLKALGVGPGDRVAIHSLNRPAWLLADLGAQGIGAMSVGIYPTSPESEVEYLLAHSGAKVLIAEDEEQVDKVLAVRDRLPALTRVVVVDPRGVDMGDDLLMTYAELEALGRGQGGDGDAQGDEGDGGDPAAGFRSAVAALDTSAPAIIVYTSGTTGPPKGALLSHDNLLAASRNGQRVFTVTEDDEVLSYLPLCHIAERLVSAINAVTNGYVVNFGDGVDELAADLREVQPTYFLGVPRVWEKLMAGVTIRVEDAGWVKRANYAFWMRRGGRLARKRWHAACRLNVTATTLD
jgi:long-chain acyl-CoA synthetase